MSPEERADGALENAPLSEQAAYWWEVLHGDSVSIADRRKFVDWVSGSPECIAAYFRADQLVRTLRSDGIRWPDTPADVLVREARLTHMAAMPLSGSVMQAPFSGQKKRMQGRRTAAFRLAAAAIVLAGILGSIATVWLSAKGPQQYQTVLGEQHFVILGDGSQVALNTASKIEVDLQSARRAIRLIEGEALFQVARDESRPFEVAVDNITVRAVGTRFNIDRRAAHTTVTVIDGKVMVGDVAVSAAERVVVTGGGVSPPERGVDVGPVIAWTQRRLVFENWPIGEVAEEFNRYNRRRIHIDSAELRRQEVTGNFEADDTDSFLAFLAQIPGVAIRSNGDDVQVVTEPGAKF